MASEAKVSRITSLPVTELGESPQWDPQRDALLYVDIPAATLHRYYTKTGRHQTLKVQPTSSGFKLSTAVLVEDHPDLLVVSVGRDIGLIEWKTSAPDASETKLVVFASVESDKEDNALNDGKCDPQGRLWIGSYGKMTEGFTVVPKQGALYRLCHDLQPTLVLPEVGLSNGLDWSPDGKVLHYVDSHRRDVRSFDFDPATGDISNERVLYDYLSNGLTDDLPDGLTTDTDGNLYVANFNGHKVVKLSPEGKLLASIPMPVSAPTCPCWGGPDYSTLYVTSTTYGKEEGGASVNPDAGGVFEVAGIPAKGAPHFKAKLSKRVIDEFNRRKLEV